MAASLESLVEPNEQAQQDAIDDTDEWMFKLFQIQLDQHAAFFNNDPRDQELGKSISYRNGYSREAYDRWPFQLPDRPGDPVMPRWGQKIRNFQRDAIIALLAEKKFSDEEARVFWKQQEDALIAKIRQEQKGENLDDHC